MSRSLTLTAILLSMFLAAMEATVVATAMPSIVAELHGLSLYGWVGAIYMLASTLTMPLYGKVADLYGRKPVLLSALFVFLVGSVASGLARSMLALVVFRAVQGVGAGGIQPVALTIVGDLYRPEPARGEQPVGPGDEAPVGEVEELDRGVERRAAGHPRPGAPP